MLLLRLLLFCCCLCLQFCLFNLYCVILSIGSIVAPNVLTWRTSFSVLYKTAQRKILSGSSFLSINNSICCCCLLRMSNDGILTSSHLHLHLSIYFLSLCLFIFVFQESSTTEQNALLMIGAEWSLSFIVMMMLRSCIE